jgi:hypothetical protein
MPDSMPADDDPEALLCADDAAEAERLAHAIARQQEAERNRRIGEPYRVLQSAVEDLHHDINQDWLGMREHEPDWARHVQRLAQALTDACQTWRQEGLPETLFDRTIIPKEDSEKRYALLVLRKAMRGAGENELRDLLQKAADKKKRLVWQGFRDIPPLLIWPQPVPHEEPPPAPAAGGDTPETGSATAQDLWEGDPLQTFTLLRDRISEAATIVCLIHEQALTATPDESLANVGSECLGPLERAVAAAQVIWSGTPIAQFLDRPEGPVYLDREGPRAIGGVTGSCYHDLALAVASGTLRGIRDGVTAADFRRMMRYRTAAGDHVTQRISSLISHVRCECQGGISRFRADTQTTEVVSKRGPGSAVKPQPAVVGTRTGEARGGNKRTNRGGKPPLEVTAPLKYQVYQRIRQAHRPGKQYADIVNELKADKDFVEQVQSAGLGKLNTKVVKNALAFFDQRKREQGSKKQETDPA